MLPPAAYRSLRAAPTQAPVFPVVPAAPASRQPKAKLSPEVAELTAPPLLSLLKEIPEIPFTMGVKADDPTLDTDPFFLRAQSWSKDTVTLNADEAGEGDVAFQVMEQGVRIALTGTGHAFHLNVPLHPLSSDEQWIYFAAADDDLFAKKTPQGPPGEGLFVMAVSELKAAHRNLDRVPVYFLPLPGNGWTGNVEANLVAHTDTILLTDNDGDTLPVPESDLEAVVHFEKIHLTLALGAAARSAVLRPDPRISAVLPLPGSTAGFGILFTGLNPNYPELNLFNGETVAGYFPFLEKAYAMIFVNTAHADSAADASTQKMISNLLRVGAVVGIAGIAAVVLRLTAFHKRFAKRNAEEPARGLWGRIKQEMRNVGDVFAHNLTFLATVPSNWFGNSVEYIVDRYFTKLGAGKHSWLKWFLDRTVYQSRDMTENVPVNWKTAVLGIGPLGLTDTALVAFQLYFVVPWMAQGIAAAFPGLQPKIDAAFDLKNPDVEIYNRNETVRNFAAYIASGASTVSSDLKGQMITVLAPEVDAELRKMGLDPTDPDVKAVRDAKFEELFSKIAKQMGLPGHEDFLFDASTLFAMGLQLLGNKVGGIAPGLPGASFLGEKRPGLITPAVQAALKEAKARLKNDPGDRSLISAVQILEETTADLAVVTNMVKMPFKWIVGKLTGSSPPGAADVVKRMRRARQTLIALTYQGPVSEGLKYIPTAWGERFKEAGCQVAGGLFRRAFNGIVNSDPDLYKGPTENQFQATEALHAGFEKEATALLRDRYQFEYQLNLQTNGNDVEKALADLRHNHRAEFRLMMDDKIHARALADIDAAIPYQPARVGWYGRLQQRRATRAANAKFQEKFGRVFDTVTSDPNDAKFWTAAYTEELMHQVDLYPDYDAMPGLQERIEAKAASLTAGQLEDAKVKEFLAELGDEARMQFTANILAENTIMAYRDIVPNLVEEEAQAAFLKEFGHRYDPLTAPKAEHKAYKRHFRTAAVSTAQPGRFMARRQKITVRQSALKTRFWRTMESFFPLEHHKTGLLSKIMRNVPTLYDLWIGNLRTYRAFITMATAGYWFNYLVWGVGLPLPLWLLAIATRFTVQSPAQWMTRLFRMQGLQAMSGWKDMTFFAFLYSWATFWGTFPTLLFAEDFKQMVEALQKMVGARAEAATDHVVAGAGSCLTMLNNAFK